MAPTPGLDVSGASVRHPTLRLVTYALPSLISSVAAHPRRAPSGVTLLQYAEIEELTSTATIVSRDLGVSS